ncbi:MAG: TolC family protein [Myxococcaceae bacterium]
MISRAAIFTVLVASSAAFAQRVVTLDEALNTAQKNQPQLRQAQAQTEAARARVDAARSGFLPQVNGNVSYGVGSTRASSAVDPAMGIGLSANQLIYDFGKTTGRYHAAQASAEAQADDQRSTLLAVQLNVRVAYFDASASKALVAVAKETLANQEKHLQQIQGFVEVGTRPEIDLAQARTDRANARVQLINAENSYETAKAQLNQAVGVEGSTDYDVSDVNMPPVDGEDETTDVLLAEALRSRPEFASASNQVRAQELSISATRGNYWPTLGASAGANEAGPNPGSLGFAWNGGVTLSWAIFQGGLTRANVAEASANLNGLKAQVDALEQNTRLEVEQARLAVRAEKASVDAAGEAATNARERLKLAEGRYQAGVGSIIELGDAQLALNAALGQQVSAQFNLAAGRARLIKALGRPG